MLASFFHVSTKKLSYDVFRAAQGRGHLCSAARWTNLSGLLPGPPIFLHHLEIGICFAPLPNGRLAHALKPQLLVPEF